MLANIGVINMIKLMNKKESVKVRNVNSIRASLVNRSDVVIVDRECQRYGMEAHIPPGSYC